MIVATGAAAGGGGGGLTLLLLALPILLLVYLMFNQRRRAKRLGDAQGALQAGQEVMTTSGIHGTVSGLENEVVHLTIAQGVVVRVDRRAIVPLSMTVPQGRPGTSTEGEDPRA